MSLQTSSHFLQALRPDMFPHLSINFQISVAVMNDSKLNIAIVLGLSQDVPLPKSTMKKKQKVTRGHQMAHSFMISCLREAR